MTSALQTWRALAGKPLGTSDWFVIDQQRIDAFADVTMDHQFIHVDPTAAAQTPFGGTVAHGLLTLSLLPHFLYPMLEPYQTEGSTFINYGSDKVRLLNPVRSGKAIRFQVSVGTCEQKEPGKLLLRLHVQADIQDEEIPALIAEALMLILSLPD